MRFSEHPILHAVFLGFLMAVIFELVRMTFARLSPAQEVHLVLRQLPDGTLAPVKGHLP
jgi:hypothetical protein